MDLLASKVRLATRAYKEFGSRKRSVQILLKTLYTFALYKPQRAC